MSIKLKLSQLSQKKKKKKGFKKTRECSKWLTAQGRKFTAKGWGGPGPSFSLVATDL